MLKTLIKLRLRGIFLKRSSKKQTKKSLLGRVILTAFIVVYVTVVFSGMFIMLFSTLVEPFEMLNVEWLYFAMMAIAIIMLGFIGSVFIAQQEIYQAKDNDLLLSMPIRNRDILLSRILAILILNYVYELLVAGPALYVYITHVGMSMIQVLFFIIIFLTLPLFVVALTCLFGWILAMAMTRVRKKNILILVLSLGFLGLYFYFVSTIQEYVTMLIMNGKDVAAAIEQGLFPIYHLGVAIQQENFMSLLIYLLCAILPFVFTIYILSSNFTKLVTSGARMKKVKYVAKEMKQSSVKGALFIRELRHFSSNAMVMLNGAMGVVFTIIAGIGMIIIYDDLIELLSFIPGSYYAPILCLLAVGVGSLNIISASLISLEGNRLWIIKSLPVPSQDILLTKLGLHLILCVPGGIFFSIVEIVLFPVSIIDAVLIVIVPILFTILIALMGLLLNLWKPKFDWVNETMCVKQSMPVILTMFTSMGLVFMIAFGYYGLFADFMDITNYTYLIVGLVTLLDMGMYVLLMTWGTNRFKEI